jgi:hypothetical protein
VSDQSSPHASHCSCKYEVEALRKENARLKSAVEWQKLSIAAQVAVREAAQGVVNCMQPANGTDEVWAHQGPGACLDLLTLALDKATEVRG